MKDLLKLISIPLLSAVSADAADATKPGSAVLREEAFRHYTEDFNQYDSELYRGYVPNAGAWEFLKDNIPLFECPDEDIQRTYYFRWWTFRKHLKQTPAGFIVDEFLPNVSWAGKYNSISCAAGHHLYEGRWLTVIWDRTGQHYGKGQGLRVVANGKEIAKSAKIGRVTGLL